MGSDFLQAFLETRYDQGVIRIAVIVAKKIDHLVCRGSEENLVIDGNGLEIRGITNCFVSLRMLLDTLVSNRLDHRNVKRHALVHGIWVDLTESDLHPSIPGRDHMTGREPHGSYDGYEQYCKRANFIHSSPSIQ